MKKNSKHLSGLIKMKPKISAIVITKNEEKNIVACMNSLRWADEIILVDSSQDQTINLARPYTPKIYQVNFDNFKQKREFGLKKAKNEWILFIDADERVTTELANEIIEKISKHRDIDGYYIPFKHIFLGKWLKYGGWYPSYLPRLAKRCNCYIENEIHERLKIAGKIKKLNNPILHYSDIDLYQRIQKTNYYTDLQAQDMFRKGIRFHLAYLLFVPSLLFLKRYIIQLGFLDGIRGFMRAALLSYTYFIKYCKLWGIYNIPKK